MVRDLPEAPGVYIFEDATGQPLYIGKSVNIKKRVMSHFSRDHAETKEFKIAQSVTSIRTQQTAGELSALLLESKLVKELQPLYNRKLRKINRLALVRQHRDDKGYLVASIDESSTIDPSATSDILAVYSRRSRAKQALNDMVKTFDLCPKLLGLEKTPGACFMYQLHKCRGACIGEEPAVLYNQRLQVAFQNQRIHAWPYKGAIMLEEALDSDSLQAIIVDKWCIIGELTQEPFCEPVIVTSEKLFDLDTYKILQSHLMRKLPQLTIKPFDVALFAES